MLGTINIYDCGCVQSRPREQSCKNFGTRWRVYVTKLHIILKCRDCGRLHHFELRRPGIQVMMFGVVEELTQEEKDEESEEK